MKSWHYVGPGQQQLQAPEDALPSLIASGAITPQTLVWTSGQPSWLPAAQVLPQLFTQHGAPPPLPPSIPAPATAVGGLMGGLSSLFGGGAPAQAAQAPSASGVGATHDIDYEIIGSEMQIVEIELDPGETVIAEAGGMNYMDPEIQFETKMGDGSSPSGGLGGLLKNIGKRLLTGESLFMTHFTNRGGGKKRVAFGAPYPGKIIALNLAELGGEILCEKDAFLCAAHGTAVGIAFNRKLGAGLFGGEGFILQKISGRGKAFIHAGGTIIKKELRGDALLVDTGCLVAFTPGVNYDIQQVGGLKSAFFGGEGLFLARLQGHGTVWLQSLPFSRLADRIIASAPSAGGSSVGEGSILGGLGRILDGD